MKSGVQVVLTQSPDIALSIGSPGLIDARLKAVGFEPTIRRELPARFDVVLQRLAGVRAMHSNSMPKNLGPWFDAHFATAVSDAETVMAVITVRDELVEDVWRHRVGGWLVQPPSDVERSWSPEERSWLTDEYELTPRPTTEQSMQRLREISAALGPGTALVVFNVSTYDPEGVRYDFSDEVYTVLAHRLDLALERTADDINAVVIDIDRIVAEIGAHDAVESPGTYSAEAGERIAEDAFSAINQLGVEGLVLEGDIMRLDVPTYDRRTMLGRIDMWHVDAGEIVDRGSPLFDLTFENLVHRLDYSAKETNRSMSLTVLAAQEGHIATLGVAAGSEVKVGQTVGIVVKDEPVVAPAIDTLDESVPPFRVGIRVK